MGPGARRSRAGDARMSATRPEPAGGEVDRSQVGLSVLSSLPGAAVVAFDRTLRVVMATGAALAEHGWLGDAVVGGELADRLASDGAAHLLDQFRGALDGGTSDFDYRPAEAACVYRVVVGPLRDGDGRVSGGFIVSRDVTAQRETEEALRGSRAYLQDILDCLSIPVSVKDAQYRFVLFNREYERLQQIDCADLEGKTVFDLYPEEYAAAFHRDDQRVMETGRPVRNERRVPRPDGSVSLYSMVRSPLRDSTGRVYGLIGLGTDVTAERAAAEALYEAHERFEQIFQNAAISKAVVSLDGRFVKVNRALCTLTGYSESSLLTRTVQDITHPDDVDADMAQMQRLFAGDIASYEMEKRYIRADGQPVWVLLSASVVRNAKDEPTEYIAQIQDISVRRELERQLRERAEHDALTGLRNRARFEEDLEQQLARCRRYGERAALLLLDLDDFKALNDEHGHRAGDDALRHVAATLTTSVRESDIVARWGGDEFVVLAPNTGGAEAQTLAEQVVHRLESTSVWLGGRAARLSGSVGLAELGIDALTVDAAFATADASMYEAKRSRRSG